MILNDAGMMINKWYVELENKFNDIKCLEHIVMPNHFHCIIENTGVNVGADLCVRPFTTTGQNMGQNTWQNTWQTPRSAPTDENNSNILGEHKGSPLYSVIQWFKTMSTNEYIRNVKSNTWQRFDEKLFQRNYYEHIIRDEKSYLTIADYIINNPKNWNKDSFNPTNEKTT